MASTVGAARGEYFARTGFSTASYEDPWVHIRLFGIPLAFPNVASRRRAIRFHDIHHVLTRYGTDPRGEAEIGAWEIAATFPDRGRAFAAAWVLNIAMFALGLVIAPRRVFRAFVRGCHCTSLYRLGWSDDLLARDVDELRAELGVDRRVVTSWRDCAKFCALVGAVVSPPIVVATACWLLATR